ncbi:MAG: HAMP domain-containing sensor histidine kinase [bacterium]|nr:HAMP domain-containing sensor histidine kinase [bacterium]
MPEEKKQEDKKPAEGVIITGGKVHQRSHLIARILVGISILVILPAILLTLGRFINFREFVTFLIFAIGFAIVYYFLIPAKYIPRFGYLVADLIFYLLFFLIFWNLRGFAGLLMLFFYLLLFGIINALSYNWRDIIITVCTTSTAIIFYNFFNFMPATGYSFLETAGLTFIEITILAILTFESRVLADEALIVQRKAVELQVELDRLQELDRLKTEFIGVASHQIRTPLSGIMWALSNLKETGANLNEDQKRVVELSFENTRRMITIVSGMLDAVKVEEQVGLLQPTQFDLASLLKDIVNELQLLAHEKKIKLVLLLADGITLNGIQQSLKQAISNIIDNAIRYSKRENTEVTIMSERANGGIMISVSDQGIGMSETEAAKVFTKFFRSPEAIKTSPDGSGLGLYYTKRIIEQHGGSISLESLPEKGTTVKIFLPLSSAQKT